jgi:predicted tellurium resistance membrane protein TerC
MAMLLNGLHILRLQLAVAALLLVVGVSLKLHLTHSFGLYGPVLGTIVAFVLIVCIAETFFIHHLLRKL